MLETNFRDAKRSIETGAQYTTALTAFDTDLADINLPRGIILDFEGTVEFLYEQGQTDTLLLVAGMIHPIVGFSRIVSSSLLVSQIHIAY